MKTRTPFEISYAIGFFQKEQSDMARAARQVDDPNSAESKLADLFYQVIRVFKEELSKEEDQLNPVLLTKKE